MLVNVQVLDWGTIYNIMDKTGSSFCRLTKEEDKYFLSDLNVTRLERGKGFGGKIIRFAMNFIKPGERVELNVKKGTWMVTWYERLGFIIDESYNDPENYRMYKIK
jgi:GNAT superfamily N-acetyltransferase